MKQNMDAIRNYCFLKSSISIISFLIFFGSCASLPQDALDEISEPVSLMNSIGQALQSQEFAVGDWPEESWWEQFHDPQLNELIVEGLQNSPNLKQANAHARATASFARQIKAKLYPYFNAHGSDNWEHLSKFGFERYFAFHSPPAS